MLQLPPPPPALPPGSSVWAYLRDSGGPTQDRSVSQQRDEILEYCQKYGLVLARPPFTDIHRSGGTVTGRTAFDEMMALSATEGLRPTGLLIWNFARFARDVDDSQLYKSLLRKRGIVIHSLTDNIPEGPYAVVIEMLVHVADEHKKKEAGLGAQRGLHSLVRQGAMPGTPPRGFKTEPMTTVSELGIERNSHRWIPDPDLVPVIQKAWAMRANGNSLARIHQETRLYNSINCYTTFFRNPIYIGELHYAGQVFENNCEPIIDQATWSAMQLLVQKNAANYGVHAKDHNHPRRKASAFLLSGLAVCARCKSPLYGQDSPQKSGSTDHSYRCSGGRRKRDCTLPRIPAHSLEETVLTGLEQAFNDAVLINNAYAAAQTRYENQQTEQEQRRTILLRQQSKARGQSNRLAAAIAESGHSRALLQKLEETERSLTAIETELADLNKQTISAPMPPAQVLYILQDLKQKIEKIPDLKNRQNILRQLISTVFVERHDRHLAVELEIFYPETIVFRHKIGRENR